MPERLVIEMESDASLIAQHLARYHFARDFVKGKAVLDVACGSGYGSRILAEGGASTVTGVDVSNTAIQYASTHFAGGGARFSVGDASDLSPFNLMDVVVSFETLEHLPDTDGFLRAVSAVLKEDGVFLVSTPVRQKGGLQDIPLNPYHTREWNEEEFEALLKRFFSQVDMYFQFNIKQRWYPLSRTIARGLARFLCPAELRRFLAFPVTTTPPLLRGIPLIHEYALAVCRGRRADSQAG